MNLKAVHDRVAEVLPKDQSFCITLELWTHRGGGGGIHAEDGRSVADPQVQARQRVALQRRRARDGGRDERRGLDAAARDDPKESLGHRHVLLAGDPGREGGNDADDPVAISEAPDDEPAPRWIQGALIVPERRRRAADTRDRQVVDHGTPDARPLVGDQHERFQRSQAQRGRLGRTVLDPLCRCGL